ncbi:FAD-dependent oxidoreductase [Cellulomonas hominis]|uniref:FAD-dependent oxidoreductase n=1 Tax=Cellulomonas hominis TaxID=156981 RepID=UPI001B9110B1|nr:FAD-dependent oxidoreductase [Cellulomonas hominis]VTR76133.1 Demethylphylloquinone reductase NdbB [Cellulomonas hominis]
MTQRVVVVGGGYAGVMAANRLAGSRGPRAAVEVVLVNERDAFVERIRLHEYAAGVRPLPVRPFGDVLHPAVRLEIGRVERIDAAGRRILLADREVPYDVLVYAAGSTARPDTGTDQPDVATAESATVARERVRALLPGAAVLVRGAGHTGVELAAELRGRRPDLAVHLLARGGVAPALGARGARAAAARLGRSGVTVHESEGTVPPTALTLRADGFAGASLAAASGLPVDERGRLLVGPDLRVAGDPHVLGAGDGCRVVGPGTDHLRMGCAAALPQGAHAADVALAVLDGRPAAVLDAGFALQCVSLGRGDGIIQTVRPDDTARALRLHGVVAAGVKELVCRRTVHWLAGEARRPGSYRWPAGPRTAAPA